MRQDPKCDSSLKSDPECCTRVVTILTHFVFKNPNIHKHVLLVKINTEAYRVKSPSLHPSFSLLVSCVSSQAFFLFACVFVHLEKQGLVFNFFLFLRK